MKIESDTAARAIVYGEPAEDEVGQLDTTMDEWRAALKVREDEGQTIDEIVEATGVASSTVRRKIKKLISEGKCVKGMALRNTGERRGLWNVYQLIGEEKCSKN